MKRTSRTAPKKITTSNMEPKQFLKLKPKSIHLDFKPRNDKQEELVGLYKEKDILFAIGAAGSGKTFSICSLALQSLLYNEVEKIIITRPLVECDGERLGFLPGDIRSKTDVFNAPIIEVFLNYLGNEIFEQFLLDNKIQIIPLAFMRGRSIKSAIMILDEAQNATINQTKMFLTRMDINSKIVITGDMTQSDLPYNKPSGLIHAINILKDVEEVGIVEFNESHVQRHPVVSKIINAYAKEIPKPASTTSHLGIVPEIKSSIIEEIVVVTDPRTISKSKKKKKIA